MKIICLGNNTEDSDSMAKTLAGNRQLAYHGLISDIDQLFEINEIRDNSVYHSTIFDCTFGRLIKICDQFDEVIMLDQPKESYSHPDSWSKTLQVIQKTCAPIKVYQADDYWLNLLETNKSFCVLPWVQQYLGNADDPSVVRVCCRSPIQIGTIDRNDQTWQDDPKYKDIRESMINGKPLPHCGYCYDQEQQGLISDRRTETLEWVNRLDLVNLEALETIKKPVYYEVRASDRCNLQCRMCDPKSSHRIAKEYQTLGWYTPTQKQTSFSNPFDLIDFQDTKKIYVSGGEPMLNSAFFKWLDRCAQIGNTDIECLINTNGTKLPLRFKKFLPIFSNLQFVFSIDGYGEDNDYIRWGSRWHDIVANWQFLVSNGNRVHVNTTVSIYNVHKLSRLYQFIDQNFPGTLVHINLAKDPAHLDVRSFPDARLAISDLEKIRDTDCYHNNPLMADNIEHLIKTFANDDYEVSTDKLQQFFSFNDQLDLLRTSDINRFDKHLPTWRL